MRIRLRKKGKKEKTEINKSKKRFREKSLLFLPNVRNSVPRRIYYCN